MIKRLFRNLAWFVVGTAGCSGGASDGGNPNASAGSGGTIDPAGEAGSAGMGGAFTPPDASGATGGDTAAPDGSGGTAMADVAPVDAGPSLDFRFDTVISRPVLENYLSRSISFTELLHDDLTQPLDARGVDPHDNIRLLISSKAKFVGRALMLWGSEQNLATYLVRAKPYIETLHQMDPDLVLQAAAFEIVTTNVETIAVPPEVFTEFGQPVVARSFVYQNIVYANGNQVNHWGANASVPDMSRLETRMWFYYLTTRYIDAGIEAIHFGQVSLMDQSDPGHVGWLDMLGRVRAYAKQHARRHMVICDAHTPTGGYVEGGKLLFDAHAFPLRIAEVAGMPFKGVLKVGYADSLFTKSKGGVTPSGWTCDHLPYLVEFDNFGNSNPGNSSKAPFIWGWDEITWFALQTEPDRNDWLRYAWKWVHDNDPVGHVEMPGSRLLAPAPGGPKWYWANTASAACPTGFNTEATIRELWGTGP
jgi:hypothetical protein